MKGLFRIDTRYKYKLLISYFLIVATPLIIMTGIVYNISADNMQQEIEASNAYKLNQFKLNLELRIKELKNLALIVNVDKKLSPHNLDNNEYKRLEGIDQIGLYNSQTAFISNYYLYIKSSGRVYSQAGQSSLSTFLKGTYNFSNSNEMIFENMVDQLKVPTFVGQEWFEKNDAEYTDYILYMYPISYSDYNPYGVVFFEVKEFKISEMLKNITGHIKGHLLILDRNNNVILSENSSFTLPSEKIDLLKNIKINEGLGQNGKYADFNNKDISLIVDVSDETGLKFILAMPKAQFLDQLVNIKTIFLEAFLIILSFGILLAIVFSINFYKPISRISKKIANQLAELSDQSQFEHKEFKHKMNELDRIGHTVEIALKQNKNLKEQINKQAPLIKEQFFMKLLKGEHLDGDTMNYIFQLSDVRLDGISFGVLVVEKLIKSEEKVVRSFKDKLLNLNEDQCILEDYVYSIELLQNDTIAFILNLNIEINDQFKYVQIIKHIKQMVEDITAEKVVLGGGQLYEKVEKINRSFIEALAALEENKVRGNQGILLFNEIENHQQQILWYPAKDQLRFLQSLKQGDKIVALETLESIFNNIKKNKSSALVIKYICYDIVNTIVKSTSEMEVNVFEYNIESLMKFSSIEELERKTKILVEKICLVVKENRASEGKELKNKIIEYMHLNFDNMNMSLERLADEFGLSTYYLSRFFKEHTNHTFTEYLIDLRMKKAKELLTTTDLPIKEIVPNIGYSDLTYFMKRFKMNEGVTPGQYREMKRQSDYSNNCRL